MRDDYDAEGIVVAIRYTNPSLMEVSVNGIPSSALANPPNISDAHGAFHWDNPTRTLTFVVKGTADVRLRTRDAVSPASPLLKWILLLISV
jgi:hypothetical protein